MYACWKSELLLQIFCTDSIPIRSTPDENHFAMLRTSEMGLDWVLSFKSERRFRIYASNQQTMGGE